VFGAVSIANTKELLHRTIRLVWGYAEVKEPSCAQRAG